MIPKKWAPVFGKDHAQKHDPEKWAPVFGKDHAQNRLKRNAVRFNFALANRRKAKELGDGNG
jgi:hypothetical protein